MATTRSFGVVVPADELDIDFCLSSGQVFRWQPCGEDKWMGVDGDCWYVLERSDELLTLHTNGDLDSFRSLFRLDWDIREVNKKIVSRAPELRSYLSQLRGHRLMRPNDPVETFFCFLCTANNNIKRITQMVEKLAAYGPVLHDIDGATLHRFPEAETIADIPEQELRSKGFGYRGQTIPHIAKLLVARGGRAWLEELKRGSYEQAHSELKAMRGIGPKLADCICLFGLHFDQAVPVDTHIWQAMCRLYFPEWKDKPLTDKRYEMAASFFRNRLGDLAGWAHQYLFYENVLNWRSRA